MTVDQSVWSMLALYAALCAGGLLGAGLYLWIKWIASSDDRHKRRFLRIHRRYARYKKGWHSADEQPWSVGYAGLFRIVTYLDEQEKEIDTDDRIAILHVLIELAPLGNLKIIARNVIAIAFVDFAAHKSEDGTVIRARENILFSGQERAAVYLAGAPGNPGVEITPDHPFRTKVAIKTGLFSAHNSLAQPSSAIAGRKAVNVTITGKIELESPNQSKRRCTKATMQLIVGKD